MEKADYFKHLSKPENGPLTQIVKIIESEISSYEKSIKIMKLLRDECIFIHHNRLHSADFSDATIKPDDVNMKLNLVNEDLVTDWHPIFANSFGPFYPSEYFKKENFRIVWLLKESYIMKDSWVKGDRGKHNQAKEYTVYFEENGYFDNDTHDNILKLSRTILTTLEVIDKEASDKEVLNHICILEVNHFPGLAFQSPNSNDYLIGEWAELNTDLIKTLVAFCKPNIIIGGHTLGHFFPVGYRYEENHYIEHISDEIKKSINNGMNFEVLGFRLVDSNWNKDMTPNFLFKTKEDCFMIDANHPSRKINYLEKNAKIDAEIIKQWLELEKSRQ
jgi:hypothetical protein